MYRPSADAPQFRPVPAAPPPPRMMGGPFISPPPSISPLGRPPIHAPMQGRPPVMQQYLYPPPAPQPPPPLLAPPPGALRTPLPLMHPSLPSMQSSLPSMQRPPLQLMRPSMPPSLPSVHSSRPLLPQPPAPVQAIFPSTQPSLPSVRPVSTQFQPSPQVQPPLSYVPAPLSSIQPAPFLPPLPPSPPSENPPPPPPPSPPPQPPPLPHIEEASSSGADLIPPEPPKPTDAEMLKNIDVLAAFVVKNGPRFESMARARQAGDPKFAFLFESDAAPEAAIGHEFYKWKKQSLALEFGLEIENKKNNQVEAGAASGRILQGKATPGQPPLLDDVPASPAMSDMDMEDDFTPSPAKEPMQQSEPVSLNAMECGNSGVPTTECKATQSNAAVSATECMNDVPIMQDHELFDGNSRRASEEGMSWGRNSPSDDSEARRNTLAGLDGKNLEALPSANISRDSSKRNHISNLIDADEHMQRDGRSGSTIDGDAHMGLEPSKSLQGLSDLSSEYTGVDRQRKLETTDVSQEMRSERQERRMGRLSRWESVPRDTGDADTRDSLLRSEDGGGQKVEKSSSPRHDESFNNLQDVSVDRTTNIDKINREISENGRLAARAPLQPNQEAVSVDEFGRLVRKKAMASDSDDDLRPQKRRRSFSRSRSGSRTRGRSRSRSRSRGRSRSRSRSPSYSPGESRWRRRSFSRSPPRSGRWSRSRSRSPHWQRNDSRSPSRDMRWGGMGRGVRDWRGERDSYGRGRREGRGSGPNICFHYARGRCFRGSACKFLHPEREIEQERGMQLADVQPPVFKDMEPAFTTHTSMTGAGSGLDPPHGIEDKCEVWRTESDRETNASSEAVYIAQGDRGRIQVEGLAPDREASDVWHDTAHAPKAAGTKDLSEAAKYAAKPFMSGEMEPIKNPAAALDLETVRAVDAVEKPDASKKTELAGELKVADRSDNGEIRLAAGSSEISESLKVDDNKGKDMDETLEAREGFATEMMLSEGDAKATKDPSEGASSPNQPSQLVVQERRDKEKVEVSSELKVLDKAVISAKKSDLISELEMLESEEIARRGSAEFAIGKSDVGGEAHGQPNGSEASKTPLSPVPFLQANSIGKSMHMASPSVNQYISSEQRQGPVFAHQPLDSGHHPSPAANRLSPQLHSLAPPPVLGTFTSTSNSFSTGPFNPSHHLLNQGPSSISGNAGARHPFPMNNPSSGQQMSIPNASQHGTLRSQPSHGSSFPSHLGFSQNPSQQSLLPPQDRMPNFALNQQPGQFSLNPPMLQGLGMAPYPAREPQESSAGFSLSKEDSAYARLFGENPRQYVHSNLSSDGLQHAYPRASIITSAAPTHSPLPWKDDSLAASRSMPVSSAEQPHYSYTLTTIPPLPTNLIKLPGGSSLPGSGEQYDPLSDVLDIGSSGALKALSGKPSGDGRSVGMGFLENVSPGLDSEKANILTPKAEIDTANTNEAATDVGVVENVSPPVDWSPVQAGEAAVGGHDQLHSKNKKSSRGLKLLRTAVADRVKVLLKPAWKEGRLSKDAFKTIAKKAVEKVTGNLPGHHIPKSQEKVDQFMAVSSAKITKLVQGYVDKYSKVQS